MPKSIESTELLALRRLDARIRVACPDLAWRYPCLVYASGHGHEVHPLGERDPALDALLVAAWVARSGEQGTPPAQPIVWQLAAGSDCDDNLPRGRRQLITLGCIRTDQCLALITPAELAPAIRKTLLVEVRRVVVRLRTDLDADARQALFTTILKGKRDWEASVDGLSQIVCILDRRGRILRANRALERWSLGRVHESPGRSLHQVLHPGCKALDCELARQLREQWQALAEADELVWEAYDERLTRDLRIAFKRWPEWADSGSDAVHATVTVEDISDRRATERSLTNQADDLLRLSQSQSGQLQALSSELQAMTERYSHEQNAHRELGVKHRAFLDNALVGMYLSQDGVLVDCNTKFAQLFGYPKQALLGAPLQRLFTTEPSEPQAPAIDTAGRSELMVRARTRGRRILWLQHLSTPIELGGRLAVLGCVNDVSLQMAQQASLGKSDRALQALSAKLLTAQEGERRRVASDLHDGLGQHLNATKMALEAAIARLGEQLSDASQADLMAVVGRLRMAGDEVRRIAMDLRPSLLDDLGLVPTLRWLFREFAANHPALTVDLALEVPEERRLPQALEVTVFRIVQEAIHNVAKHAQASRIACSLKLHGNELSLLLHDDGCGFEVKHSRYRGAGLQSLRERARLAGGKLNVRSRPGAGTTLTGQWRLPAGFTPPEA